MTRVSVTSVLDTLAAVVKVRALEALVTHTKDTLVTAVAQSVMPQVTTGRKKSLFGKRELNTVNSRLEVVARVVAVLQSGVAAKTKIVVIALHASDKLTIRKR